MEIKIKATNIELTPDISGYVDVKMGDVEKFINANDPASVAVYFEVEKTTNHHKSDENLYRAEANLQIDGRYFRADAADADMNAAIDQVKDEVARQVKADQNKRRTLLRKGGAAIKNIFKGFSK